MQTSWDPLLRWSKLASTSPHNTHPQSKFYDDVTLTCVIKTNPTLVPTINPSPHQTHSSSQLLHSLLSSVLLSIPPLLKRKEKKDRSPMDSTKSSGETAINIPESSKSTKGKALAYTALTKATPHPRAGGWKRGVAIFDFILRIFALVATLAATTTMGTTDQTLPFFTQFFQFQASYDDLPAFTYIIYIARFITTPRFVLYIHVSLNLHKRFLLCLCLLVLIKAYCNAHT